MPKPRILHMQDKEVNSMKLISNNKVLVKIVEKNVDRRTKGGIWLISPTDTSWNPDIHANRWGRVIKVPKVLKREKGHLWETTCELEKNDLVWWDFMISENADTIVTEYFTYLLLDYFSLHVAKRGDKIIILNAYQMFELVPDESSSKLAIKTGRFDSRYGILKHKGSLNKYLYDGINDDPRINVMDKCVFKLPPILLESEYHAVFGERLRISQLYNISAFIRDNVLRASVNHIIIIPEIETHRGGVEIPLPFRKPTGIGTIYDVHCLDTKLKKGQTVCYFPEAATTITHNGQLLHIIHKDYLKYYL